MRELLQTRKVRRQQPQGALGDAVALGEVELLEATPRVAQSHDEVHHEPLVLHLRQADLGDRRQRDGVPEPHLVFVVDVGAVQCEALEVVEVLEALYCRGSIGARFWAVSGYSQGRQLGVLGYGPKHRACDRHVGDVQLGEVAHVLQGGDDAVACYSIAGPHVRHAVEHELLERPQVPNVAQVPIPHDEALAVHEELCQCEALEAADGPEPDERLHDVDLGLGAVGIAEEIAPDELEALEGRQVLEGPAEVAVDAALVDSNVDQRGAHLEVERFPWDAAARRGRSALVMMIRQ